MPRALNPADLRAQVTAFLASHPELWDDQEGRELAVASETDGMDCIVARMLDAEKMSVKQAALIKDLKARRDRYLARYEAMRKLAFDIMQEHNIKKLELTQATLSIRLGQPKVVITDETKLPDRLCRIKREPDKLLIRQHLESGAVALEGASLSNAEPVLAIRVT